MDNDDFYENDDDFYNNDDGNLYESVVAPVW